MKTALFKTFKSVAIALVFMIALLAITALLQRFFSNVIGYLIVITAFFTWFSIDIYKSYKSAQRYFIVSYFGYANDNTGYHVDLAISSKEYPNRSVVIQKVNDYNDFKNGSILFITEINKSDYLSYTKE